MAENHIIVERKDLGKDGLVAVPESIYPKEADQVYDRVGLVTGLSNTDFDKHSHWDFNYIPIEVVGGLKKPSEATNKALTKGLENLCQSQGANFDQARLLSNQAIATQILDYEIVEGDLYVVRFTGKELQEDKDFIRCLAYFVSPEDGPIGLNGNQVTLNDNPIDLPNGDLQFAISYSGIEGTLDSFKAGSAKIHRKNLKPYASRGTYGSGHSNGPWIVLQDKLDSYRIELMKSTMRID